MSTSKEREKSEFSIKSEIYPGNKYMNSKELKKIEKEEDNIFNSSNDLLNENIKLTPMINPIPCFTVKKENSTKDEISTQNTFYSNNINSNNNQMNTNISYNIKEENKKEKTKILNKNLLKTHLNKCINNNRYFRQYSPNFEINNKNEIISYSNKRKHIINNDNNKFNYEIFISNKKKFVNNISKKKLINPKNILSGVKKHKFLNHLYFSTDNSYESNNIEEKMEKLKEKKEEKEIKIKLLGRKINEASMKIEILQNYKKNKNINAIKKKIEYNKIYCNNNLKRLKDNYFINIRSQINQIKYMKMKLMKCQECYMPISKHKEEIKKEELLFKIKKMEIIEKILFLKKKLNDIFEPNSARNDVYNLDDSLEEKTINDVSFNDYSILKDTFNKGVNIININNINKIKGKNFIENKIIKMNKHQINFFKTELINKVKNGK